MGMRSPVESDLYGLRISQILFPNPAHEIGVLRNLSQHYNSSLTPITEANTSAMGLISSLGLFVPFAYFLFLTPLEKAVTIC